MSGREPGFVARFPDYCDRCRERIVPGERVIRRGIDELIHVECASGQDDE